MKYAGMKSVFTKGITMKCAQARAVLSPYLDGAVSGTEMRALQEHLEQCARCMQEYTLLRQTQQLLVSVGRPQMPADLDQKIAIGDFTRSGRDAASAV